MADELLFLGDFFYDYEYAAEDLEKIAAWIRKNGFQTVLNLEGGFFGDSSKEIVKRGAHLHSHLKAVELLKSLQTAGVCLANNHMMDFGSDSLTKTLDVLNQAEILHVGAGRNLEEAVRPMNLSCAGKNITILNFGWDQEETVPADEKHTGCAPREEKLILQKIYNLKKNKTEGDRIVVCMHWGFEYNRLPQPYDIDLAHKMIDAGADLVIGHHPHVIQPMEIYKGKRIYYSLGDFYFSSRRVRHNRQFKEKIAEQCDYGIGVIWNPEEESFQEIVFHFDRGDYCTKIIEGTGVQNFEENVHSACLEDISGVDYNSKTYYMSVVKRKKNINPILTTDLQGNKKKILRLAQRRKLRRLIKNLLHR